MTLSSDQVSFVRKYVERNGIRLDTLRDDVLDHLCCSVEVRMHDGKPFERALKEATDELAPEGLRKLEYETILLLNSKNVLMKKFMYFIGLASAMAMSIGFAFQILHMPGGYQLTNYGFLTFALAFLPALAYNSYRANVKRNTIEKFRTVFGFLSAACTGVAVLFKMMHYPGVDPLLLTGAFIFSFGFLPCMFYSMYSRSLTMQQ